MNKLKSVYAWKAYHNNGLVTHGGKLNRSDLIKFELIAQAPHLRSFEIDLKDRELIYYMRVFNTFGNIENPGIQVYKVEFHVGYKSETEYRKYVIDAETGDVKEYGADSVSNA